jgi:hypothetical protein
MADHLDAPGLTSPANDARVDITDHYAFQKPGDPGRTVLILNVNPLAPTHANEFRPDAVYETLVDTNGDARPDIAFRYRFSHKENGKQFARVKRVVLQRELEDGHLEDDDDHDHKGRDHEDGDHKDDEHEDGDEKNLVKDAPVSFGRQPIITHGRQGVQFFAGIRSDPFFFDLLGFLNGLKFTGSDFFINLNVFSIVVEVPNRLLGPNPNVGIWTRTLVPMMLQPRHVTQVDQMGRPAINTVFNHGNDKNLFNVTQPAAQRNTVTANGQTFLQLFTSELEALGGYSATQAAGIAQILLPDVLTFNYTSAAGFLNGRRLQDDVIDIELNLVTNGKVKTDGVGPHTDYLTVFPFVGTPHNI